MNERILKSIWKCESSCLLSKNNFNASLVSTFKISRCSTLLREGKKKLVALGDKNQHVVVHASKERNYRHREKNQLLDDGAEDVCAGSAHNNRGGSRSGEDPQLQGTHYTFRFDKGASILRGGRNRDFWKKPPVSLYSTVTGRKDEREGGESGKKDADAGEVSHKNSESLGKGEPEPPMCKKKLRDEKDNQLGCKGVDDNGDTMQNERGEKPSDDHNSDLQRSDCSQSRSDEGKDELNEKLRKKNELKKVLNIIFCSSIPMIGFGFMDQFIMIRLGDIFDASIGVSFGISTLCAASFGQLCSDTFGIFFGYFLNYLLQTYKVIQPTKYDVKNKVYQHCTLVGSVFGILLGCALGMLQLIFIDTTKSERLKKKKELDFIFQMVMCDCSNILNCEASTLFLYDKAKNELWSKAIHGRKNIIKISANSNEKSFNLWVLRNKEIINCKDVVNNELYNPAHDEKFNFKTRTILAAPILDRNNEVVGVLMFLNKLRSHGGYFTRNDEKLAEMMSKHISIFMEKFNYISEGDKKMIIFDKEKNISREGEEEEEEEENDPPVPNNSLNHNQAEGELTREHTHEGNQAQIKQHPLKERKRKRPPKKNLTYQISQIDEDDKIFDEGSENANIKQFDEYYEGKTEDEEEQDDVYDEEEDDDDEEEVDNPAHQGSEEGCKATQPSEGSIEKEQTDKVDEKSREIINLLSTSKMEEKKNEQPVNHFLVEDHSNHRKDHLNPRKNISKEYQSDPVDCKVEMIKGGNDQHETHKLTILNIDKKLTDHEKKKIPSSFVDFNSGWSLPVSSHPPTIVGRITSDKLPDERKRNSDVYPHPPIHRSDEIDRTKEGEKEPTNFDTLSIFPNVEIFFKSYQKGKYNFYEKNFEENINLGNRWKKLSRTSLRTMLSDGICAEGEGTVGGSNSEVRYPHVELGNHYRKGDAGGHLTDGSSSYNSGVTSDYTYYYDIEHTSDYGNLYVKDFANGVTANSAFENERKKEQKDSIESYHRGYNSAILSETLCRNSSLSVASGIKEESFRRHKQNYVHAKEVLLKKVALLEGAGKMYSSSAYNSEKYFSHIHFAKIFNMVYNTRIVDFKLINNYILHKIYENTTVSRLAPSTCYNIKIIDFFFRENLYLLNKSTMNDIIYKYIIFYYCRKKLRKKNFNYYNYQDMYIAENFFGQNTHTKKVPKILDEDLGKKSAIITVDR